MKYLYPYECEKRRLSTPDELQAAIDGNRREGRRSSYGQYESMQRSPNPNQISPLSLVSQQQQQLAARMNSVMGGGGLALAPNGVHHPSHPQPLGQPMNGLPIPSLAPSEFEARMMEYVKLLNKEIRNASVGTPPPNNRQGDNLTPPNTTSPLNHMEMSRFNLWNLYNNNNNHHQSPPVIEPQKEALNLADAVPMVAPKREPEQRDSPPPPKRVIKEEEKYKSPAAPSTHIKINSQSKKTLLYRLVLQCFSVFSSFFLFFSNLFSSSNTLFNFSCSFFLLQINFIYIYIHIFLYIHQLT